MKTPLRALVSCILLAASLSAAAASTSGASQPIAVVEGLPEVLPETCYLFSYFKGKGQDGLHLAWSADGYTWKAVPGGPRLSPQLGDKIFRDPCIKQGPDGVFHMVWTASWTNKGFGHASSTDLVTWSEQQFVPAMEHEPATQNVWAPELHLDEKTGQWLIIWSSTITERFKDTDPKLAEGGAAKVWNHRLYATTTHDWKSFSPTTLFYDDGYSVIDALIVPVKDRFAMVVKDERLEPEPAKDLRIAWGRSLTGPFGPSAPSFSRALVPSWVEGPALLQVGARWFLYADVYKDKHYVLLTTTDFASWTDETKALSYPAGLRHGTAFPVKASVLRGLFRATAIETPAAGK